MCRSSGDRVLLVVTLVVLVAIGLMIATDYGAGIDACRNSIVGWNAVQSYWSPVRYAAYMGNGDALAHHGPSYFMVFSVTSRVLRRLLPGWHISDGRNFTNYLTFLAAVAVMYLLSRRLLPRRAAWIGMLLFATQPLLFGHGFINQKDTPFMGFFAVSVIVGMAAADRYRREQESAGVKIGESRGAWAGVRAEWQALRPWTRWIAGAYLLLAVVIAADILALERGFAALQTWVTAGYLRTAASASQIVFDRLLPNAPGMPLETLMLQVSLAYWVGRTIILALILGLGIWIAAIVFPVQVGGTLARHRVSIGLLVLAGGLVGFTISIRPIGAFAGALILLYWLWKNRLRGVSWLVLCGLVALWASYLTWPYLWDAPWSRLMESLKMTAEFPPKETLFRGRMVSSDDLPWDYFPTLVSIELTEVAIPLFLVGLGIALTRARRLALDCGVLMVLAVWIVVPLLALWFLGMGIYNNIKHLHFILLPMFVFAALGLESLLRLLPRGWMRWGAAALVLVPGIVGIVQLHPFEYTYFNGLVGGVRGASGEYTLDRFCTSSRMAMEYVNREAEKGALIAAPGAPFATSEFARPDLQVSGLYGEIVADADFIVTCSFYIGFPEGDSGWEKVYEISPVQGVVYGEVWKWSEGAQ